MKLLINENTLKNNLYFRSSNNENGIYNNRKTFPYNLYGYGIYFSKSLDEIKELYNKGYTVSAIINTNSAVLWEDNVHIELISRLKKELPSIINLSDNFEKNDVINELKKNKNFEIQLNNKILSIIYDNERFQIKALLNNKIIYKNQYNDINKCYNIGLQVFNKMFNCYNVGLDIAPTYKNTLGKTNLSFEKIKTNGEFYAYAYALLEDLKEVNNLFLDAGIKSIKNNIYNVENICVLDQSILSNIKQIKI